MAKNSTEYLCTACSARSTKWLGRCGACGEFATLKEVSAPAVRAGTKSKGAATSALREAVQVGKVRSRRVERLLTGVAEFDRVLGGGLVSGQVVLVAGEPGVGKSTLLLDVGRSIAERENTVLYVSGEESSEQVALRAQRIGAVHDRVYVAEETELEQILAHLNALQPDLLIVDSVQTVATSAIDSRAGGVAQVHEVTQTLTRWAKEQGTATLLVGQSTRENSVAGPRALEHLVDTVLTFEGDRTSALRMLRTVKNRFGPTDEVACFEHEEDGLREVSDPSGLFRKVRETPVPGSCLTVTIEGRRPLLAEIQGLVAATPNQNPRRGVTGLESNRTAMLITVTDTVGHLKLGPKDVYAATVGGAKISDPGADLAVCLAVASAEWKAPMWLDTVVIGEVTLSGDIRSVPGISQRVGEAARLGFKRAIIPSDSRLDGARIPSSIEVLGMGRLVEVLGALRPREHINVRELQPVNAPF